MPTHRRYKHTPSTSHPKHFTLQALHTSCASHFMQGGTCIIRMCGCIPGTWNPGMQRWAHHHCSTCPTDLERPRRVKYETCGICGKCSKCGTPCSTQPWAHIPTSHKPHYYLYPIPHTRHPYHTPYLTHTKYNTCFHTIPYLTHITHHASSIPHTIPHPYHTNTMPWHTPDMALLLGTHPTSPHSA